MKRREQQVGALGRDAASGANTQRSAQRPRRGRAYRSGRLICGCVRVTISDDERLGLTRPERRLVRVCFHEPLDDGLRAELIALQRRRGPAARRAAERIEPIEVVVDDPQGERQRILGRVEPPQIHHGPLCEIAFALRSLEPAR